MKFLLGQKKAMTQVFQEDGNVAAVTVVHATPNVVTDVRQQEKNGYTAVQLGFGEKPAKRINKPQAKIGSYRWLREFRTESKDGFEAGKKIDVSVFAPGDVVDVTGVSKGRGFAGVMKRHNFSGSPATHGHKHDHRAPGSIGATFPQHVIKGRRMPGRMGNARATSKNLKVIAVDQEKNEILISGAIPGPRNGLVMITAA